MKQAQWNDHRIELIIGNLLRAGVVLAGVVVLAGAAIYLAHHHGDHINYRTFHAESASLRSITGVIEGIRRLSGEAIIQLGLLLLIATPVARVVFSAFAFTLERDYLYVGLTLLVLAILIYGLVGNATP